MIETKSLILEKSQRTKICTVWIILYQHRVRRLRCLLRGTMMHTKILKKNDDDPIDEQYISFIDRALSCQSSVLGIRVSLIGHRAKRIRIGLFFLELAYSFNLNFSSTFGTIKMAKKRKMSLSFTRR